MLTESIDLPAPTGAEQRQSDHRETDRTPLRVLFFEDDQDDLDLILRALHSANFDVTSDCATTLEDFLARASSGSYDVVLSDYRMPGVTGMDCFAGLKAKGLHIPFILTTGSLGDEKAVECLKEGVADYVLKDRLARLPVAIHRALQEQRLRLQQSQALAALRRSEASYRSLIQSASCGILRLSAVDGRLLEANAAMSEMLGYSSPDDLLANGSTRGIVLDPESVAAANQTSANEGYLVQTEISWNRKDGVPLTIGLSGRLLRDEKGAPACFEMVAEDVTSRRRAEQRIRQLNRLYSVLSYTGQAIGRIRETTALCREICRVIVEQGHFTSAWIGQVQPESGQLENVALWASGDAIAPITGCGSHELTCCQAVRQAIRENRHIITRHTPPAHCTALDMNEPTDDMASAMAVFPVQVNDNPVGVITIRAVDPSLFDDENVALLDELASNLSFALTSLSRERMKQRTIEELNQFFVLSRDLLCIASMDGYIYRLNPAWERTLGYSLEEICHRPWVEFVHPEDRPSASAACAGFTAGRAVDQLELRFIPKDGPQRWLTASAIPLVERGIIFAVLRDVTERKKLDEQLRIKNLKLEEQNRRIQAHSRMKSEFLANMSHELRSPLNGIIGFTEVLYDGKLGQLPDRPRDLLSRVLKGAKHLLQLINGVLDLSKVEAGRLDVKGEPFGLSNVVQEVVASLDALASEKRIRIATNLAPEVEDLVGDPNRLKQILYNYLSNAIKFTGDGGMITVRSTAEGTRDFRLEVTDTGIGIDPKDIPRLFTEFLQLDSTAAKRYQGTGLGLVLTRRIAEALGGHAGVESYPGKGSTFYVVLPREVVLSDPPAVLVIEDGRVDSFILTTMLQNAGFLVESAHSCADGAAKCAQRRFAAITLDVKLPDGTGREMLSRIRSIPEQRNTPVIIVWANEKKDAALESQCEGFLTKPVDPVELIACLRRNGVEAKGEVSV